MRPTQAELDAERARRAADAERLRLEREADARIAAARAEARRIEAERQAAQQREIERREARALEQARAEARRIEAERQAALVASREAALANVPPAIAPRTAAELVDLAQEAPRAAAKRAEVEGVVELALIGKALNDLRAIPFTAEELASDASLAFLRQDPHFRATGNVRDNFGASKAGLPQITIEADGRAYLSNGRHRLTVARELGLRQIIARVRKVGKRGGLVWEYVGPIRV